MYNLSLVRHNNIARGLFWFSYLYFHRFPLLLPSFFGVSRNVVYTTDDGPSYTYVGKSESRRVVCSKTCR